MKIAYIAQIDANREDGVTKKIHEQLAEWQRRGSAVQLFAMARCEGRWEGWGDLALTTLVHHAGRSRFSTSKALAERVLAWKPDLMYFRMGPCYPAFRQLAARIPMVVEHNSADLKEARLRLSPLKVVYHRLTRRALLRRARGVVAVSREVVDVEGRHLQPVLVLGNGISLEKHPTFPAAQNTRPRLVFVGTGNVEWHGIDKIMCLAEHLPMWHFDIIGQARPLAGEPPENVVLHGHLSSEQYNGLLADADVAIGTLALHRKEMHEASPLKTREYLARGLPTIIAYHDTDFPSPVPFLLQIPNTPDNISTSLARIEQFVHCWKGRRVPQHFVRHLDVQEKEARRMAFFREALAARGSARAD